MRLIAPTRIESARHVGYLAQGFRARKVLAIDLSLVTWISPIGVVAILSLALAAQKRGIEVSVRAPATRIARTYLDRIGFWAELKRRGWIANGDMNFDPDYEVGACLPVARLSTAYEVDLAANRLQDALAAHVAPGMSEKVWTVAVELTQNAREHGSECYMVVQTHTGKTSGTPGIHVAVADFGPGFSETLRRVVGRLPHDKAIVKAFEERVSGTGSPERGFGLGFVSAEIDSIDGAALTIVSRTAAVTRCDADFRVTTGGVDFRGTLAEAYLPYSAPSISK